MDEVPLGVLERHVLEAMDVSGTIVKAQILDLNQPIGGQQDGALDGVLELPDVAGPGVSEQQPQGLGGESAEGQRVSALLDAWGFGGR